MATYAHDDAQMELFEIEGQLAEEDIIFLEETKGLASYRSVSGNIVTPFRGISRVSIGDPIVLSLENLLQQKGQNIPAEIAAQLQKYEFYQVHLACSFQAASGCRFHDATFTREALLRLEAGELLVREVRAELLNRLAKLLHRMQVNSGQAIEEAILLQCEYCIDPLYRQPILQKSSPTTLLLSVPILIYNDIS
jgi:hypothetical protein